MSKWVKVRDEMPPLNEDVLVRIWNCKYKSSNIKLARRELHSEWFSSRMVEKWSIDGYFYQIPTLLSYGSQEVTHWLPLPEHPKG